MQSSRKLGVDLSEAFSRGEGAEERGGRGVRDTSLTLASLRREPSGIFKSCKKDRGRMHRDAPFHTLLIRQPALCKLRSVATFSRKRRLNRAVNPRAATVRGIKVAVGEGLAPPEISVNSVHPSASDAIKLYQTRRGDLRSPEVIIGHHRTFVCCSKA